MKNTFLLYFTFFLFITFTAGAQGIQFEKSNWAAVQAKAKAENKHIFVDVYTTWCGPCKWQSKRLFPQKQVGDFFNKNFVSFKLDAEKGEGVAFSKKYPISGFPTLLFFTPQGKLAHRSTGGKHMGDRSGKKAAKVLLKEANDALNPERQAYTLQRRFEKGERSNTFLKKCIQALSNADEDFSKPTAVYLAQVGQNHWATAKGWKFISKYGTHFPSEAFEYVIRNRSKFEKIVQSKEEVDKYIDKTLNSNIYDVSRSKDKQRLAAFKKQLKELLGQEADKHIARIEYAFYVTDKKKSEHYINKYFDKYCDNARDFDMISTTYYYQYSDSKHLEKALTWSKKSINLVKKSFNTLTQAQLLFKLQRYQEARKVALESAALAKKEKYHRMLDEANALLEKIKAKL